MKVRLTKRAKTKDGWQEPGHVIDHADAHWLVKANLAEEIVDEPAPVAAAPIAAEASTDEAAPIAAAEETEHGDEGSGEAAPSSDDRQPDLDAG